MKKQLVIDDFLFCSDLELSQFRILALLKRYEMDFRNHRIFPGLTELTEITKSLNKIIKRNSLLLDYFPIPVREVNVEKKRLFFENFHMNNDDVERVFELMKWAIPRINNTIEAGLNIKKLADVSDTAFIESSKS